MLQKVEPPERGIPHFKDIYVADVVVKQAKKGISASGLDNSVLKNFQFKNVTINAANAGEIIYGQNWSLQNVSIKAADKSTVSVKNSTGVSLWLRKKGLPLTPSGGGGTESARG